MTIDNEMLSILVKDLAVPGAVVFIGGLGAVRLLLSKGERRQKVLSAAVALGLAISAAVSIMAIATEQVGIRPENPYPLGMGGVVVKDRPSMSIPILGYD